MEDGEVVYLRNEIRVEATTSAESEKVVKEFENMLGDVDKSGTLRFNLANNANLYVTGDLAMLQSVLEGLSSSQIESTLISLAVSFLVLFLLTRRIMPAIVILFPVGIASLWGCWFHGSNRSEMECIDRNGNGTYFGYWHRLLNPHVATIRSRIKA